ncbi:ATP-dependent DNA helicase Rep [Klebsiella michiganensis]|nr:ATP-dependent DNA helicase Rep [Klebsiella michiganensis]
MGLTQTLNGRGYESLTRFTHWLREIQQLSEREPIAAVRDLIRGVDYESWLYETSPSPKAAEMRMKNVNTLFTWMTEMLEGSEIDEPMTLTQVVTRFTLRDMMERGESDEETDQVQLMTLHASKGWNSHMSTWLVWKRGCCRTRAALMKTTSMKSAVLPT